MKMFRHCLNHIPEEKNPKIKCNTKKNVEINVGLRMRTSCHHIAIFYISYSGKKTFHSKYIYFCSNTVICM